MTISAASPSPAGAEPKRARARRRAVARPASSQLAASTKVLRSLLRITEALTSELEPEKAYDAILSVVRDVTGAEGVSLQLLKTPVEGTEPVLVLVETLGLPDEVPVGDVRSLDGSIAGWVIRHRKPLLLNGPTHPDPEVRRLMRKDEDLSAICVPLINKGHPLGVLNARKDEEGDEGRFVPFTDQDLDFLAILAGQVAIALENARLFAQIAQQAMVDGLTGLLNHATFQQRLEAELERAARSHQQLALLEIDLDGFKMVNDTYGHPTGDKLLQLLADRAVLNSIRPYDVACRPGGDEFAVILPHTSAANAVIIAERIRDAVAQTDTSVIGVPKGTVAASVGVAHFPSDAINREDLVETADNALYFAKYLGRNRVERGSSAVANFERDPRKLHELLVHANQSTVEALAAAIDARDQYTAGHSRRVAEYALELAKALGHGERFLYDLRLACLFHDVGKIAVPDAVLRKSGKLSEDEFSLMRSHPVTGAEILEKVPSLRRAVPAIRHHHERWDGTGYPAGLKGEEIPEMARIISIADAYDAMTSDRVYRAALLPEDVARIFRGGSGVQWDARLVERWIQVVRDRRPQLPTPETAN
ncbi:MAG TPA: diguanylate cyclase [Chloroflexota bacterium]|nr:diguanylate cyclase [Chloroflexota bacterium]